jgi:hypothetical protein
MTQYRAGYTGTAWTVERSPDGLRPEVIATLPTAKAARAFIASVTGELSPIREEVREGTDRAPRGRSFRGASHPALPGQDKTGQ